MTTIDYDSQTNMDVIYEWIGLSMVAAVDYAEPDVQLDFTARHTGERNTQGNTDTQGEYPGYDRFGRAHKLRWVDGGFTTHASSSSVPNIPSIVELLYTYDEVGNVLSALDGRVNAATASQQKLSHEYLLDGLYRLSEAERGTTDGSGTWMAMVTRTRTIRARSTRWPRRTGGRARRSRIRRMSRMRT